MSRPDGFSLDVLKDLIEQAGGRIHGNGFHCFMHEDRRASGSFFVTDDGHAKAKCHSCDRVFDANDLAAHLAGQDLQQFMRETKQEDHPHTNRIRPGNEKTMENNSHLCDTPRQSWATLTDAVKALAGQNEVMAVHEYIHPGQAGPHRVIIRLATGPEDPNTGKRPKSFRQISLDGGLWIPCAPKRKPWSLYGSHLIRKGMTVVITEGECCADAVNALCLPGVVATTSAGGAGSPDASDWAPLRLAGKVIIWPDNDEAGAKYASRVVELISKLGCKNIAKVDPGKLDIPLKGDVVDYIQSLTCAPGPVVGSVLDSAEALAVDSSTDDTCCSELSHGFDLVCAADVKIKPVEWLWRGFLPAGAVCLLAGHPGCGKSYLTTDIAARVSRGGAMPGGEPVEPGRVLILSREDAMDATLVPRLAAGGANLDNVDLATFCDEKGSLLLSADIERLIVASKVKRWRLIVVDTAGAFGEGDGNNGSDVRAIMTPLGRLALQSGACVVVVHHLRKPKDEDKAGSVHNVLGSGQFSAAVRVVNLLTVCEETDARVLTVGKTNLQAPDVIWAWKFGPPVVRSIEGLADDDVPPSVCWHIAKPEEIPGNGSGKPAVDPDAVGLEIQKILADSSNGWMPKGVLVDAVSRSFPKLAKAGIRSAIVEVASRQNGSVVIGHHERAEVVALAGRLPETPRARAERLWAVGMTTRRLQEAAGVSASIATEVCRHRASASDYIAPPRGEGTSEAEALSSGGERLTA
jgi:hypothetical protein